MTRDTYGLQARLNISLPAIDPELARVLVDEARIRRRRVEYRGRAEAACLVSFEQVGPAAQMALEAGETLGRVVLMMYLVEIGASAKSFYG